MVSTKSDMEIAYGRELLPVADVASKLGLEPKDLKFYGEHAAKVRMERVQEILANDTPRAPLVLVSAISPTAAGAGKTTCSIGLAQALNQIGRKATVTLREPSMGPVFGRKGGAAGGGYSQVLPMEDINLHFTGDMHAIGAANNLIAAVLDNEFYFGNPKRIASQYIFWRRAMDMNDRTLRGIITGQVGNAVNPVKETGFDITPASEIMAVLCLSETYDELKQRIDNILLSFSHDGKPFYGKDLGVSGAATALLKDALQPNLVQTYEHGPAFVHGGPFANIAQGTCSVLSMKLAQKLSDIVVTEAGFGFDLGGEKFLDLIGPKGNLTPRAVVLVATASSLKLHGGVRKKELGAPNAEAVLKGAPNLEAHVASVRKFGLDPVIAINRFATDTQEEIDAVVKVCEAAGVDAAVVQFRDEGGKGGVELAEKVVAAVESSSEGARPIYEWNSGITDKIERIATQVYGADGVEYTFKAQEDIHLAERHGFADLPICMAKTPVSLSDDPKLLGRPTGFTITVRSVIISASAGFLVPLTGDILRMPGLPRSPSAYDIDIDNNGRITGLF